MSTILTRGLLVLFLLSALCWTDSPAQAAIVTQLDITSGSVDLNFGSQGTISDNFTRNGLLVMGQYQPPPDIFPPITLGHLTFSIFTSGMPFPGMPSGVPVPTGQTAGSTITVDLRSLFAGISSSSWGWMNNNSPFRSLNIGGNASGIFNEATSAFDVSWTHAFTGIPFLTSGTFTLQGTAQVVPLPASVLLFGTGLIGLGRLARRSFKDSAA